MSISYVTEILKHALHLNASDVHLSINMPPVVRINGQLTKLNYYKLNQNNIKEYIDFILDKCKMQQLQERGDTDICYSIQGIGRFRINIYKQMGNYNLAIRIINPNIPSMQSLGIPPIVKKFASERSGLVLITGPAGSGKSTTLACMIDYINKNMHKHIITLEDPIEYLHRNNKSIINQREIYTDSPSYSHALRAALRQDPDVILVGEMRDLDTISTVLTAAETGHLVLSTLHTTGAAKTIDRIIDIFSPKTQHQIRTQLSMVLKGVISQQLIPSIDKKNRVLATEIMLVTPAISNMIRNNKVYQIFNAIQTGSKYEMRTMDSHLAELYSKGMINRNDAIKYSCNPDSILELIKC